MLGEAGNRAFGLNKPLHCAAALIAFAFTENPVRALREEWGLERSEDWGIPDPKARLKALPYAALCVQCKSGGLSRR